MQSIIILMVVGFILLFFVAMFVVLKSQFDFKMPVEDSADEKEHIQEFNEPKLDNSVKATEYLDDVMKDRSIP